MGKMISMTEDGMMLSSEPIHVSDFINMSLAAQLNMFNDIVGRTDEKDRAHVKGDLYDMYNSAASAFLKVFAPEIELRPDLTAEAIMKAENEILDDRAAEVDKTREPGMFEASMHELSNNMRKKMKEDGLIPLDSLDADGKPKVVPFHKK